MIINNSWMIARRAAIGFHEITFKHPWSSRRITHSIANPLRTASRSISHIILFTSFINPRAFLKVHITSIFFSEIRIFRNFSLQANHILIKFSIPHIWISPIQISLPVIINKDCRINAIIFSTNKRLPNRILKRTIRRIPH